MIKIDSDGYKAACIFLVLAFLSYVSYNFTGLKTSLWVFWIFIVVSIFIMNFFRDPERKVPQDKKAVLSAADGVIIDVSTVEAEGFVEGRALRIAVFMNIFNVHVNRSPVSGKVLKTVHRPGKKLSAFNKRAEYENEHGDTDIETFFGIVRIRQIAGLLARRVITRVKSGDVLERGDRIGIIRLGSRVDVYLPLTYIPVVTQGDHVRAGESAIARPENKEN
ncbi:MAG TPA: phosphatidylserine decarboxylase [bacterium]|nr:phosphatidylserine decarboxylase [bacterium]